MAGQKDKDRFIFFKYVPPKKGEKPQAEGFGPPHYGIPVPPVYPGYPEEPECPELPAPPEVPECPEMPEIPEFPEVPELPECPEEPELPEFPELPEIPAPPEMPGGPCPKDATMHVLQAGDTFWKLAKKYGTSVEAIEAANPDVDPLNLQIGATICVPPGIPGAKG